MDIPFFLIDSFASQPFTGATTAVLLPPSPPPPELSAPIVAELGAHDGAYVFRDGAGYRVRFYDRRREIPLCTHAALAAAHAIATSIEPGQKTVALVAPAGPLTITFDDPLFSTFLPRLAPGAVDVPAPLAQALRVPPVEVLRAGKYVAVYADESDVVALSPDPRALAALDAPGLIVTAPGKHHDFVLRSFAIDGDVVEEEQVSASAQSRLVPYWSKRLEKTTLRAQQLSPRRADLLCEDGGGRVRVAGRAIRIAAGTFFA